MKSWDGFSIKEWYNCHPICIIYQHLPIKKAIQPQKNGFLPVKEQLRDWEKKTKSWGWVNTFNEWVASLVQYICKVRVMRCNTSRNEGTLVRKIPSGIPKGQFGTLL